MWQRRLWPEIASAFQSTPRTARRPMAPLEHPSLSPRQLVRNGSNRHDKTGQEKKDDGKDKRDNDKSREKESLVSQKPWRVASPSNDTANSSHQQHGDESIADDSLSSDIETASPRYRSGQTTLNRQEPVRGIYHFDRTGSRLYLRDKEHMEQLIGEFTTKFLTTPETSKTPLCHVVIGGALYALALQKIQQQPVPAIATSTLALPELPFSQPFPYDTLPPLDKDPIRPMVVTDIKPEKYLCPDGYRDRVLETIQRGLYQYDSKKRVAPMALVGCSRSGKSTTLIELAAALAKDDEGVREKPLHVLSISFNEFSSRDQASPLQALLTRMVFAFTHTRKEGTSEDYSSDFESFCNRNYYFELRRIREWLEGVHCIVFMDELNNLFRHLPEGSAEARYLGDFLRARWLSRTGQYFVFSSHVLGTVESLGALIDSSEASSRAVIIQQLPVVFDMHDVVTYLNHNLNGPLEAIYYGLLPGLILDQSDGLVVNAKLSSAVDIFRSREPDERKEMVIKILKSLFSGDIDLVPPEFHSQLTAAPPQLDKPPRRRLHGKKIELHKISWVPFLLEYILQNAGIDEPTWLDSAVKCLTDNLADMKYASLHSGRGFELLFATAYLARSIARLPFGDILPEEWTMNSELEAKWNSFSRRDATQFFADCKTWQELEAGLNISSPNPTIAIFVPKQPIFEQYDMIVLFIKDRSIIDKRAFQLTHGSASPKQPPSALLSDTSFAIKDNGRRDGYTNKQGWKVVGAADIEDFFGETGKNWTPWVWNRLNKSFDQKRRRPSTEGTDAP